MSFRALWRDVQVVHRAAAAKGQSAADFMLATVIGSAYADLGIKAPVDFAHSARSLVNEAAAAHGMTAKEFATYAARELARRELEERSAQPKAASSHSQTRMRAQRSG